MYLTTSWYKIYKEHVNTEFRKVGTRPPHSVQETGQTDKSKYFHINRQNHNIDDCIQLKDVVEMLI